MTSRTLVNIKTVFTLLIAFLFIGTALALPAGGDPEKRFSASASTAGTRALKDPDEVVYAIIAPQGYSSAFQPLADWKTETGIPTEIFTVEDIIGSYPGEPDVPAKIHKFLRDLKSTESNLTYVLLASDSESIPPRYLYTKAAFVGFSDYYAGDVYYAGLDNDWDKDNDGYYGEYSGGIYDADLGLDVTVGRLPVGNVTQSQWNVDNILNYEQNPPSGDWVNKMEIWGTIMEAPNDATKYDSWEDNAYEIGEILRTKLENDWSITARYDYNQLDGGNYNLASDNLKKSDILTPLENGLSVINYAGQAWYNGDNLAHYHSTTGLHDTNYGPAWPSLINHADAAGFNNGYRLPFLYLATCDAANFTETSDSNQEKWFYNDNGGAIGLLSNTGTSYRGEEDPGKSYGNWWLMNEFWDIFKDQEVTQPAVTWTKTLERYKTVHLDSGSSIPHKEVLLTNYYGYVYLGDPTVDIWTDTPRTITLEQPSFYTGTRDYTFRVWAGGEPVNNARICLRSPSLYTYFNTNSTGHGTVELTFSGMDTVNITVTGHNSLPKSTYGVVQVAPADLQVLDADISVLPAGTIEAGSEITISAKVSNEGEMSASDTTVHFYDGNPVTGGTLIESAFVGTLAAQNSKTVGVNWTVDGGAHTIHVSATLSGSDLNMKNNNGTKDIYVVYPELRMDNANISFKPQGKAVVGSQLNITFTVGNYGECDARDVLVELYDGNRSIAGTKIATKTLDVVPKDGSASMFHLWTVTPNDHLIYVYVNHDRSIFEGNYNDNTGYKLLYVNEPPVVAGLLNQTVKEDDPPYKTNKLVDLSEHITDGDNEWDELSVTLTHDSPNALSVDPDGWLNLTLNKDWAGTILATINVDDSQVVTVHDMKITVLEINDPPVINLTKLEYDVFEDLEFTLDVDAYDLEGDAIQFSTNSPIFDIDKTTGLIKFTPSDDELDQTYYVNISAVDARGGADSVIIRLNLIGVNDKPVITPIGNQEIWVGDTLDVTVTATDPDSNLLTFSDDSNLFVIDPETGRIQYTPAPEDEGVHTISITVSDGERTDSFAFVLTVKYNGTADDDDDDDVTPLYATPMFWILIAIVLLALIAVIVIVVMMTRKKPEQRAPPDGDQDSGYDDKDPYGDEDDRGEEPDYSYLDDEPFEEEPPRRSKGKKGRKGKGKKLRDAPSDLEKYTDALMSQVPEEEDIAPDRQDQKPLMDDLYVGGDEEEEPDLDYADRGEMDFDPDSFDDAFDDDELDTEDFDPDYEEEDDY